VASTVRESPQPVHGLLLQMRPHTGSAHTHEKRVSGRRSEMMSCLQPMCT
jgi:hypothetical protein